MPCEGGRSHARRACRAAISDGDRRCEPDATKDLQHRCVWCAAGKREGDNIGTQVAWPYAGLHPFFSLLRQTPPPAGRAPRSRHRAAACIGFCTCWSTPRSSPASPPRTARTRSTAASSPSTRGSSFTRMPTSHVRSRPSPHAPPPLLPLSSRTSSRTRLCALPAACTLYPPALHPPALHPAAAARCQRLTSERVHPTHAAPPPPAHLCAWQQHLISPPLSRPLPRAWPQRLDQPRARSLPAACTLRAPHAHRTRTARAPHRTHPPPTCTLRLPPTCPPRLPQFAAARRRSEAGRSTTETTRS